MWLILAAFLSSCGLADASDKHRGGEIVFKHRFEASSAMLELRLECAPTLSYCMGRRIDETGYVIEKKIPWATASKLFAEETSHYKKYARKNHSTHRVLWSYASGVERVKGGYKSELGDEVPDELSFLEIRLSALVGWAE